MPSRPPTFRAQAFVAALFLAVTMIAGCAGSPVDIAETPAQRGFAILGEYNALLEPVVEVIEDESVGIELRRELQDLEAQTTPVMDSLQDALEAYIEARNTWRDAPTDTATERLNTVTDNLEQWVGRAGNLLSALDATLADAR